MQSSTTVAYVWLPLLQTEVDLRHAGWVTCPLPSPLCTYLQLELKGPDQSLRIRQVKVLGLQAGEENFLPVKKTAADLQQDNCEAETLRVFRILTAQVCCDRKRLKKILMSEFAFSSCTLVILMIPREL